MDCRLLIVFLYQKDSGARAAENFKFLASCVSSAILIQTPNVKALAGNGCRQTDFFPLTHWSAVIAAGRSQAEPEIAKAALAELCQNYWSPLYSFVRSRGYSLHDAQDLTQSFFVFLIEYKIYKRVDPQKGRFRAFLLASIKNFLANASDRERTLKRGGQNLQPLREEQIKMRSLFFRLTAAQPMTISSSIAVGQNRWSPWAWNSSRQSTNASPRKSCSTNLASFLRAASSRYQVTRSWLSN